MNDNVELVGFIHIQPKNYDELNQPSELNKIEFRLPGKVRSGMKK